jgi:hypothetical protein
MKLRPSRPGEMNDIRNRHDAVLGSSFMRADVWRGLPLHVITGARP